MSYRAKKELLLQIAPRYREASPALKTIILDEFVAATGYARKYAIRLLHHPGDPQLTIQRPRVPRYGPAVQEALHVAWTAANQICTKRLMPFLPTLVASLERHEHLHLTEQCRRQLLSMSPATADRLLRPARTQTSHGLSTTRPGTLLKKQIPIRTFQDWNEVRPGFAEVDVVAHCGTSVEGAFLSTLTLTDVATGWTECLPLRHRGQEAVIAALKRARHLLPFPLLGLDTDNGGEFINVELAAYCEQEQLTFTRGRPRKSNDQCFVEQKNGAVVRQVVGYERFSGEAAFGQLTELYRALRLYVNCFQPSMKLQSKQREGSRVRRTYDQAQTPLARLIASGVLTADQQHHLEQVAQALDPLRLLRQLEALQKALWRHAIKPGTASESGVPDSTLPFSVQQCAERELPGEGITAPRPSLLKQARRKTYQKSGRPRDWRTRPDPFAGHWEQVTAWLLATPERTAVDIFVELERLYPGRWQPSQKRTLQRGVQKIRRRLLVTFDDHWGEDTATGNTPAPILRAEVMARDS
jgi:hypothetical protein